MSVPLRFDFLSMNWSATSGSQAPPFIDIHSFPRASRGGGNLGFMSYPHQHKELNSFPCRLPRSCSPHARRPLSAAGDGGGLWSALLPTQALRFCRPGRRDWRQCDHSCMYYVRKTSKSETRFAANFGFRFASAVPPKTPLAFSQNLVVFFRICFAKFSTQLIRNCEPVSQNTST